MVSVRLLPDQRLKVIRNWFKGQKNIVLKGFKGQKKHRLERVQRSKKHCVERVQRPKKHRIERVQRSKKHRLERVQRAKNIVLKGFKSQKNMVLKGFKGLLLYRTYFHSPCSLRPYSLISLIALVPLSSYCLTSLKTYGYLHRIALENLWVSPIG
jgi:hypothetical protein